MVKVPLAVHGEDMVCPPALSIFSALVPSVSAIATVRASETSVTPARPWNGLFHGSAHEVLKRALPRYW